MLGEMIYEEKGKTTGVRVLSSQGDDVIVEIALQTEGTIRGVAEKSLWTYWSKTRADGTLYGEGKGVMTTEDGDVIHLTGSGAARSVGKDGSIQYRGAIYFHKAPERFSRLNGTMGVFEYDVDPKGNTVTKIWEWK